MTARLAARSPLPAVLKVARSPRESELDGSLHTTTSTLSERISNGCRLMTAGGAAAWIIRGGDVFRNAQVLTLKRLFGGGGFCRGFCGVRVLILDLIFCRSRRHGGLAVYLRWVVRKNRMERPPTFHGEPLTLQTRPTAYFAQRCRARVQRTDSSNSGQMVLLLIGVQCCQG